MIIAVDFDGTCVTHEFPRVGRDIGAQVVLKNLVRAGHKIILWTMRSGVHLDEAVGWFDRNGIPLFGVNENPEQVSWTTSPKVYAHLYIDDAAMGAPLKSGNAGERAHVDWAKVQEKLYFELILR